MLQPNNSQAFCNILFHSTRLLMKVDDVTLKAKQVSCQNVCKKFKALTRPWRGQRNTNKTF